MNAEISPNLRMEIHFNVFPMPVKSNVSTQYKRILVDGAYEWMGQKKCTK